MALEHKYVIVDITSKVVVGVINYKQSMSGYFYDVEVDVDISDSELLGYKYDMDAEYTNIKTATSFTAPSSDKYFDEDGIEQDIS